MKQVIGYTRIVEGDTVVFDPSTTNPHLEFLRGTVHDWTPVYEGEVVPDADGIVPLDQLRRLIASFHR